MKRPLENIYLTYARISQQTTFMSVHSSRERAENSLCRLLKDFSIGAVAAEVIELSIDAVDPGPQFGRLAN